MDSGRVEIALSIPEFDAAIGAARLRMVISAAQKANHATTYDRTWVKRMEEELVGACGELAVGKWADRFFIPSVNTFHRVPDCLRNVEVRATAVPKGRLIVRDNDHDERVFVLAVVSAPTVALCGWIRGGEAKHDRFLDNPNGYRKAWFVPQEALRPMAELNRGSA